MPRRLACQAVALAKAGGRVLKNLLQDFNANGVRGTYMAGRQKNKKSKAAKNEEKLEQFLRELIRVRTEGVLGSVHPDVISELDKAIEVLKDKTNMDRFKRQHPHSKLRLLRR